MFIKSRLVKFFGIIIIFWFHNFFARDNSLKFKHIQEGLSQSTIQCIIQDHKGFMWIGTNNGLNRYDGTEFIIYENIRNDSTSLSDKRITALCEDAYGNIWVGTSSGLNRYDRTHDSFIRYFAGENKTGTLSNDIITAIAEDSSGNLWIGTNDGVNYYDQATGIFTAYNLDEGLLSAFIEEITADDTGKIWVATRGGNLHYFDPASGRFVPHSIFNSRFADLGVSTVMAMATDAEGNLWVGTQGQGLLLLKKDDTCIQYVHDDSIPGSIAHNVVLSLLRDSSERLWVGTENYGLDLFNPMDNKFTHFTHDPNDKYSLSSNSIYSLFEDKDGNLWVGTFYTALNMIDPYQEKFEHYYHIPNLPNSLSSNTVSAVLEDVYGNLWIGTDGGGVNYFDRRRNRFTQYRKDPNGLKNDAVLALCYDDDQNLWIGTWAGGISVFNPLNSSFIYYNRENCGLESDNIFCLYKTSNGNIYIGTNGGGLGIYDKNTGLIKSYRFDAADSLSISSNDLRCIYQDISGNVWIGTYDRGLNRLRINDRGNIIFEHFLTGNSQLSDNHIRSLFEDSRGNFWVGTVDGGLNRLDRNSGGSKVYRKEDGLPGNSVFGILEDFAGNLWISTESGLCKFEPDKEFFRIFNMSDGLQGKEFSFNASCRTRRGDMIFGGRNGFNLFNPDQVRDNPHIPDVFLTELRIHSKKVKAGEKDSPLTKHISETKTIVLSYKQSFISFDYVGINYSHGDKNQYAYILEGLENDWNYVGNQRTATYTNLSPGKYTFRVKAANNDNQWNEQGTSITIIITPPFWVTWWFRAIIILVVIGSAYLWYRRRMNRIRRQNRELEQKVAERTEDLRNKTIALESSKKETDDILHAVGEGLFLLNKRGRLGTQYASILEQIFEKKNLANMDFLELIESGKTDEKPSTIKRFLQLQFKKEIDGYMLENLNPLTSMELQFKDGRKKHLTFEFTRIYGTEGNITDLMATVRDITEQVVLEQRLADSENRTNRQLNWMLSILHVEPDMLQEFIDSVQKEIDVVEATMDLERGKNNYRSRLEKIYRSIHMIKGNAGLLALQFFADQAHQFEDIISQIQKKEHISAEDFGSLKIKLQEIRESVKEVYGLLDRIHKIHSQMRPKRSYEQKLLLQSFINLTMQLSQDTGKQIKFKHTKFHIGDIPHNNHLLVKDVLIQLIRNSVAHGIEMPDEREKMGKKREAMIEISSGIEKNFVIVRVRDDGRGLQLEKLRKRAIASGKWNSEEVNKWTDEQVINSMFVSGISTADTVDQTSGRGVGMDIVREEIEKHKGVIDIAFARDQYCEFTIKIPLKGK